MTTSHDQHSYRAMCRLKVNSWLNVALGRSPMRALIGGHRVKVTNQTRHCFPGVRSIGTVKYSRSFCCPLRRAPRSGA